MRLKVFVKQAGSGMSAISAEMLLDLEHAADARRAEAYEILLREVIDGRLALFNRRDELEQAWQWVMPILDAWAADPAAPHPYPAGSNGPEAAEKLLAENGDAWAENDAGSLKTPCR